MKLDTAIVLAAIVLALVWPAHQQLTIRALRYSLRRQRTELHQHARAIRQLQMGSTALPRFPTPNTVGPLAPSLAPMPVVGRPQPKVTIGGVDMSRYVKSLDVQADPDPTLRLRRPPALDDIEATIVGAGRPLTRATISERLGRDVAAEIRDQLLAHTLRMVPTRDEAPAYWPASHPVPGDTLRMARLPVLPGAA